MVMEDREKPSWAIRTFGPIPIILGSISALIWFFYRVFLFLEGISSEIVIIEKGSFYMLGVGVGLLALAFVCVQEFWVGKLLTKEQSSFMTKLAIIGVVLTFTVPQLVHFASNSFLQKKGYSVCEEASQQWLFVRNIVYIKETIECSKIPHKK
jgi:hypothetical protein